MRQIFTEGGYGNQLENSKAVVIGASADSIYAIKVAKEKGIFVCAIDGNADAAGFKEADKVIVQDISNISKIEEIVRELNSDFVLPVPIGRYLYTVACVNEACNLKGIKKNFTEISVDKFKFHKFLNKNGLRNVKLYLLKPYTENIEKVYDIKFPAIIKPRYGSGSRDVFYVKTQKELKTVLKRISSFNEDFVLEEAVCGDEYGVDAVKINGKLHIILVRKKIMTPLPQRQAVAYISVCSDENDREIIEAITNKMTKVCETMEYDDCLIQADLIVNEKDVFIIEISPRQTGHNVYDIFVPFVTGIDMIKEYINYIIFGEDRCCFKPVRIKKSIISFFDLEEKIVNYIPTEDEIKKNIECELIAWKCDIKKNTYMDKVTNGHSIMKRGYFILQEKDEEKLIRDSNKILSLFHYSKTIKR